MKYYHLSDRYLGYKCALTPCIPRDPMPKENTSIKRVCVTDSIWGGLIALRNTYYNNGIWFVYTLFEHPVFPINVPDSHLTGEMWFLDEKEFNYERLLQVNVSSSIKSNKIQEIVAENKR